MGIGGSSRPRLLLLFIFSEAPPGWADRGTLWNAVERAEKTKDSRLAREMIVALPLEIPAEEWKSILTEFITEQFVSDGMCADVAIHDTDGHNPHAHILLTVRPLNQNGTWQYKTCPLYFTDCLLTSATEKRACDNGTRMPIAADINSYAKNISIPAAKATVRSCVFCFISFRT
ncbi:MAG: MobA/MobL family protein [Clostridia bacterium]|nr:MobA/MobL family protein [Clostridia bacterium]